MIRTERANDEDGQMCAKRYKYSHFILILLLIAWPDERPTGIKVSTITDTTCRGSAQKIGTDRRYSGVFLKVLSSNTRVFVCPGGAVVPYAGGTQTGSTSGAATSASSAIIIPSNGNAGIGVTTSSPTAAAAGGAAASGQALVVGGATAGSNIPPILVKRDLVLAVRRIAPASIEPSPALFRDVTSELKTVH